MLEPTPLAVGPHDGTVPLALLLSVGLAAVHLFAGHLRVLDVIPRSRWLSLSGGASVAYVFVHLLPEVEAAGRTVERTDLLVVASLERHVYLVALLGFVAFYGLERFVIERGGDDRGGGRDEGGQRRPGIFWVHVGSFALYNALVGYLLLHREEPGLDSLVLFAVAMGLHFLVNDYGLRDHHGRAYDRAGRWLLAVAVLAGSAVGSVVTADAAAVAVLFSFLAGSVVLNVIKEELPEERESRFPAFALGAALYTALLLLA